MRGCLWIFTAVAFRRWTCFVLPSSSLTSPVNTQFLVPWVVKYFCFTQVAFLCGCLLLAHCHNFLKIALSTELKVLLLAPNRWYVAHPRITGLSLTITCPAELFLCVSIIPRTFFKNAFTFFFEGVVLTTPLLYLRTCCPRKSKPSLMCVMMVFSCDRESPRSSMNTSMKGFTSCSRRS